VLRRAVINDSKLHISDEQLIFNLPGKDSVIASYYKIREINKIKISGAGYTLCMFFAFTILHAEWVGKKSAVTPGLHPELFGHLHGVRPNVQNRAARSI
jgi:hypothetical protein